MPLVFSSEYQYLLLPYFHEFQKHGQEKYSTFQTSSLYRRRDLASKSSKTKLFWIRHIFLHRLEGVTFDSNKEATTITILTVFPVDDKERSGKSSWSRMLPFSQVSLINTMSTCSEQTRSWARSKLLTLEVPTLCYDFMLLALITWPFNGTLHCLLLVVVGPGWLIISPQSSNKPVMKPLEL